MRRNQQQPITKRILALMLVALIINIVCVTSVPAAQQTAREDKAVGRIRKEVKRYKKWTSDDPVKVTLRDGTTIRGHITEATDDHFEVTDRKTQQATNIDYAQVKNIDVGFGKKTKIALGVAAGVLVIVAICAFRCRD